MNARFYLLVCCLVLVLALACAGGPNMSENIKDYDGRVAGFWRGLWHGIISPVTFIISLFSDRVHFYEVHNNGNWYNIGYLLGILILFGGSHGNKCKK
ncbi:MAG: hypothetical protein PVJ42_09340 [bacterium]|jgi:hypothetical protein